MVLLFLLKLSTCSRYYFVTRSAVSLFSEKRCRQYRLQQFVSRLNIPCTRFSGTPGEILHADLEVNTPDCLQLNECKLYECIMSLRTRNTKFSFSITPSKHNKPSRRSLAPIVAPKQTASLRVTLSLTQSTPLASCLSPSSFVKVCIPAITHV